MLRERQRWLPLAPALAASIPQPNESRMKLAPTIAFALAALITASTAAAQSARELKRELRQKESAAKKEKDADKLCAVADWASEKGLAADAKRIFTNVLKLDADHAGANAGLGNAMWEGKWMPKKKVDDLRKKAMDAEFKSKGFEKIDDIWVDPKNVEDAKRGVFHHEGDLVTKEEKLALVDGMVRHPDTGQLIPKEHIAAAENHYYPIGREGRWGDTKAANTYYGDFAHPWIIRTTHGTMMTTLPMEKIEELKVHVDRGFERVSPLLGGEPPLPPNRPIVIVATSQEEYSHFGNQFGDETSSATACLMSTEARIRIPFHNESRAAIADASHKGLAPYYTRHGAAMAYLSGKSADSGATLPKWFEHGIGALASRFENDWDGAHFCRTGMVPQGGVKNVKGFINGFTLNGDMQSSEISYNVIYVGLLIHFATKGGDKASTDAMVSITEGFKSADKAAIESGVESLAAALIEAEAKIGPHMQKMMNDNK